MSETNDAAPPPMVAEPTRRGRPSGTTARKPSGESKKKRNPAAEALQVRIDTALKLLKRACDNSKVQGSEDAKADFNLVAVTIDILEAE